MGTSTRCSAKTRERAIRMVLEYQGEHDSQWSAICSDCREDHFPPAVHEGEFVPSLQNPVKMAGLTP
jgi:hypothetical protein